jgi:hypothetical protein
LKFINDLHEIREISDAQKGYLKDMVAGQNLVLLRAARKFDLNQDVSFFRDVLKRLVSNA